MRILSTALLFSILAFIDSAHAQPPALLHEVFRDHAVLQREKPISDRDGVEPWSAWPLSSPSSGVGTRRAAPARLGDWRTWGVPHV